MKTIITLSAAVMASALLAPAQDLRLYEGFAYAEGDLSAAADWNVHSGDTVPVQVGAGSLSYPGLVASTGNHIALNHGSGSREDLNREFVPITSGTAYYSAIVNITAAPGATDYFLHLAGQEMTGGNTRFQGRLFVGSGTNAGTARLGILASSGTGSTTGQVDNVVITDPLFIVVGVDLNDPSVDTGSLWVNPPLGQATPPAADATSLGGNFAPLPTGLLRVAVRQGSSGSSAVQVDELRVGTTWAAVTPGGAPETFSTTWELYQ